MIRSIKDSACDIELAQKGVFAISFHMTSSDPYPKHMQCLAGPTSWCFWQRSLANGREQGSQKEHETLSADIGKPFEAMYPCQDPKCYELFHTNISKIAPKAIFVGRKTTETAVSLAACQFFSLISYVTTESHEKRRMRYKSLHI